MQALAPLPARSTLREQYRQVFVRTTKKRHELAELGGNARRCGSTAQWAAGPGVRGIGDKST